jgi:putative lipoprotein
MARAVGSRLGRSALPASILASLLLTSSALRAAEPPEPSGESNETWWGPDKALHLGVSLALGAIGYGLGVWAFDDRWAATGFGASLAIGLGATKEALDAAGLGEPSWQDFAWDVVGVSLGIGVSVTFDAALRGPER